MNVLIKTVLRFVARRPSSVAGLSIFAIGFSLVAANALYSQPGKHPVPLWATRDAVTTRSLPPSRSDISLSPATEFRSDTNPFALDRIPVPVSRPDFADDDSGQEAVDTLITDIQQRLKQHGFYKGDIDGLAGPMTRKAIAAYQTARGLNNTGEISRGLLDHLDANAAPANDVAQVQPEPVIAPTIAPATAPRPQEESAPVIESIEAAIRQEEKTVKPQPVRHRQNTIEHSRSAEKQTGETAKDDARLTHKASFEPGIHEIQDSALVARVQIGLINFGETGISVDGVMTDRTRQAIRTFQQRYGLAVTGVPDLAVIRKMEQIGALQKS